MGLSNMRERAAKLGGEVNIQTSIGEGTIITVKIPFVENC